MAVATHNVRSLAVKKNNGNEPGERVLAKGQQLSCDVIGLQETRRPRSVTFRAAGYRIFCSGQGKIAAGQELYGVGLAVKESFCSKSVYTHQFIDERSSCLGALSWLVDARRSVSSLRVLQLIVPRTPI